MTLKLAHAWTAPPVRYREPAALVKQLVPLLRPHQSTGRPPISDDGFFDSVVTLGLCAGLDMMLSTNEGRRISYRALSSVGLSVADAWRQAARNVMDTANTSMGIRFLTRPAHGGIQLRTPGTETSAWLAHPALFTVLHEHAITLLGTANVAYLVPHADTVVAVPSQQRGLTAHLADAAASAPPGMAPISSVPLLWSHGFPVPMRTG